MNHRRPSSRPQHHSSIWITVATIAMFWVIRLTTVPTRRGDGRVGGIADRIHNEGTAGAATTASDRHNDINDQQNSGTTTARNPLLGPPCNAVITKVTKEEIQAVASAWVDIITMGAGAGAATTEEVPPQLSMADRDAALHVYFGGNNTPKYDLLVSKVCGSCADHMGRIQQQSQKTGPSICGPDVYGYEAPHSAIVFHPLDPTTGQALAGERTVGVGFQGTRLEIEHAFSTHFPVNVTQRLKEVTSTAGGSLFALTTSFVDVYPLMAAASMGLITYGPDYIGAGESARGYDRSYLTALPVEQAAVVNYYNLQAYTEAQFANRASDSDDDGCNTPRSTIVSDQVLTWGYSAGGAAVVFGTAALQSQGLNIVRMFTQAGVYNNPALIQAAAGPFLRDPLHATIGFDTAGFWALVAAAYSNEAPFLQNTGTGQTLLSMAFTNPDDPTHDILEWIFDEKITAVELKTRYPRVGHDFLATVNPALFAPIGTSTRAGASFCDPPFLTAETDVLCAALLQNSPVTVLDELNDFPIEWCHSPGDQTVPFFSTQAFLLAAHKPNVEPYKATLPFLRPFGGHGMGQILCSAAVPTFLMYHLDLLLPSGAGGEQTTESTDPPCHTHPNNPPRHDPQRYFTTSGSDSGSSMSTRIHGGFHAHTLALCLVTFAMLALLRAMLKKEQSPTTCS
uniref:Uncharacterized protein n=1 Tax=Amphora coffeiformis TaxID=265554 RepID=A0A7S3L2L2_9STRA